MPARCRIISIIAYVIFNVGGFIPSANAQDSVLIVSAPKKINTLGLRYDFTLLDKKGYKPWHLVSLEYTRGFKKFPLTARINYANRFNLSGWQVEADAYPVLSKKIYAYLNAGYSPDKTVLPKYRAGFSLYLSLPAAYEAEAGLRYLYFNAATFIYTGSVGKYYKNYWFNFSSFLTPAHGKVSGAYFLKTRYYLNDTDFIMLLLGTGISPDDKNNNIQFSNNNRMASKQAALSLKRSLKKGSVILLGAGFTKQEYLPQMFMNQYNGSIGFQKMF